MEIGKIDKNFAKKEIADKPDTVWYDIRKPPFEIYGLYDALHEPVFCRMPKSVASTVSEEVEILAENTSGGRVRFRTDSPYIAIRAVMPKEAFVPHMPATGTSGFDLYVDEGESSIFVSSFRPDIENPGGIVTYIQIEGTRFGGKINSYTINFPLYDCVTSVEIGIKRSSALGEGVPYKPLLPFVYYGSSITQGGCASRPGNSYQGFLSRRFNVDFINLGFSGSGRGEQEIIDYICGLNMSLFICDYDYNAGNAEELSKHHYHMYECFRKANPITPYLLLSKPDAVLYPRDTYDRRMVVEETYRRAIAFGDKNIYYINGETLFQGANYADCTVDAVHPNDLGFFRMSQVIGDKIEEILGEILT